MLSNPWFRLVLALFATYRLTHLVSREDGPFALLYRLRKRLGAGFFGELVDCFNCVSVWVAAPFAWIVASGDVPTALLAWLALSGAVCWLQRLTERSAVEATPIVIERLPPTEERHELLWTAPKQASGTNGPGERSSSAAE